MPLATLELTTFGVPFVRVNGSDAPADVGWRKNVALLTYLALAPQHTCTRSQMIGLLWPEVGQKQARHSLNDAIHRLRGGLGLERIQSSGPTDNITLAGDNLSVDALEFERVAGKDGIRALEFLRGDFLEGFAIDDSGAFDAWLRERRRYYRNRHGDLLVEASERALAGSQYQQAVELARDALLHCPMSEPAVTALMLALAWSGNSTSALAAYSSYHAHVEKVTGDAPGRTLHDLAERLRSGRWLRMTARHADTDPPLVGRDETHRRAFSTVATAMGGGPTALAIIADSGLGKTRLLNECRTRFLLSGGMVVLTKPLQSDHDAPYSTMRALFRNGLAEAPGVAAVHPDRLAMLSTLVPEITAAGRTSTPQDATEVANALGELLRAVADEQPLMIALDDAHQADSRSIYVIHAAISQLSTTRVFCAFTTPNDVKDTPVGLVRLRGDIQRGIPGNVVRLKPLTAIDIRELVSSAARWCSDDEERDRLARRVVFETGGNPFLSITLLRGLEHGATLQQDIRAWPEIDSTLDAALPISVPDLAKMAIVANVSSMPQPIRDLLTAASVLESSTDTTILSSMLGIPKEMVETQLETVEQSHLLEFDGAKYSFAAPIVGHVIQTELLTSGNRRVLRERAIEALAGQEDIESRLTRARLRAENHPGLAAAEEAGDIAREAAAGGAPRTARRAVKAAERAWRKNPLEGAIWLAALRQDIEGHKW